MIHNTSETQLNLTDGVVLLVELIHVWSVVEIVALIIVISSVYCDGQETTVRHRVKKAYKSILRRNIMLDCWCVW